ncbi:protein AMBP isoform X2 [Synchiropus splendidus]|uniref:protein AMBP isoform X2 n=1 Tax=Synchiropus splendidus TaxID=270530 RepID=UPI00237DC721|nr:protein AMBP isoform X2 [Synchiropus splendidus]
MQTAVLLVSLLVLGWTSSIQGVPLLSEPLFPTQENFDLSRFLGTWHDVAAASSCPWMKQYGSGAIGKLVLKAGATEDKLMMEKTGLRHGTCSTMTGEYQLTSTPGRFFYHIERWQKDVDAYVVHTNYEEYAIIMMMKYKADGQNTTSAKLYSRTMDVRPTILDDFKTLVMDQGISEDAIVYKENKGDCVPGERVQEPTSLPEVKRVRRSVLLAEEEASGDIDDTQSFNPAVDCSVAPDMGPCFSLLQRYFYNSTSMTCESFSYGGCSGNQNNFITEKECLQRCRTEAVCRLPMVGVACTGQPPIWAFDSTIGRCVSYKPGFCQTNGNKFYSKAECEEYCGVVKEVFLFLNRT